MIACTQYYGIGIQKLCNRKKNTTVWEIFFSVYRWIQL